MNTALTRVIGTLLLLGAEVASANSGWTNYVQVAEIAPTSLHYYVVRIPVCESPSGGREKTWFCQDYSDRGADQMFRTLLEAMKSALQVRVYVTGVCNLEKHPEISSVSVIR